MLQVTAAGRGRMGQDGADVGTRLMRVGRGAGSPPGLPPRGVGLGHGPEF